jgi:hypothetical protein
MIQQSARKRCIWIVLALFSAIAVAGDGLHFLPGLGHDCRGTHRPLAALGDCHRSNCSEAGHFKNLSANSVAPNSDDCPVCRFFTQSQSVPLTVVFEIDYRVVEGRVSSIRPLLVDRVAAAYSSRAPPSLG